MCIFLYLPLAREKLPNGACLVSVVNKFVKRGIGDTGPLCGPFETSPEIHLSGTKEGSEHTVLLTGDSFSW